MLITTALSTTEPADFTPATGPDAGFDHPANEFGATLGEITIAPIPVTQLQVTFEAGQTLPPDGNILPLDSMLQFGQQVTREPPGEVAAIPGEMAAIPGEMATIGDEEADGASALPATYTQLDAYEDGVAAVEATMQRYLNGSESRQPGEIRSIRPGPEQSELPLVARRLSMLESQAIGKGPVEQSSQQLDAAARAAVTDRQLLPDAKTAAHLSAAAAVTNLGEATGRIAARRTPGGPEFPPVTDVVTTGAAALSGAAQTVRAAPPPAVLASIDIPLQDKGWGEALSERVLWMSGKTIQKAEIRLNPADMGPIRVEVSVVDDVATVRFNAQHAVTREAIDQAMPRLRELLGENGISLANPDIADANGSREQHAGENPELSGSESDAGDPDDVATTVTTSMRSRSMSGLVDTFV